MVIYWTPADGQLPAPNINGIGIRGDNSFQVAVVTALGQINATQAGNQLLSAIVNRRTGNPPKFITIHPFNNYGANACRAIGEGTPDSARVDLARFWGTGDWLNFIQWLKIALYTNGIHISNYTDFLYNQIREIPIYTIRGAPANIPSSFGIIREDINNWFSFRRPFPKPFRNDDAYNLINILMIIIEREQGHISGDGASCIVYWNPDGTTINLTTGIQDEHPSYISLAHELVHAYYNMHGRQLSISEDSTHFSTVLYEYMCVGLGPWVTATISENAIRTQAGLPIRPAY